MDSNVAMPTLCTFHRLFLEKSAAENKGIALKSDRTFSRAVWRVLSNLSFWELYSETKAPSRSVLQVDSTNVQFGKASIKIFRLLERY